MLDRQRKRAAATLLVQDLRPFNEVAPNQLLHVPDYLRIGEARYRGKARNARTMARVTRRL
jgi:hypothetical protein